MDRRRSTSVTAMCTMLCSPADTRWTLMATRSTFTTAPRIARSPWLAPVFAHYLVGWILTEVANDASARRMYETAADPFRVYLWMPPPSPQSCVHDSTPHIQGLLRLRTGIRLARRAWIRIDECFSEPTLCNKSPPCALNLPQFSVPLNSRFGASDCSLLNSLPFAHRLECGQVHKSRSG